MLVLKIALRNLWKQGRRSAITAAGFGMGFAMLSFANSTTEGTYDYMIDLFTRASTGHAQLHRAGYLAKPQVQKAIPRFEEWEAKLLADSEVKGVAPRIHAGGLGFGNGKTTPLQIEGIDLPKEKKVTTFADKQMEGSLPEGTELVAGRPPALIGSKAARLLKAKIGDELVIISQGADGSVANGAFTITGILKSEASSDVSSVYLRLPEAQEFLALEGRVHELAIRVDSFDDAGDFSERWTAMLKPEDRVEVDSWMKVEEDFYNAMMMDKRSNVIPFGIITFVVAVGVLNTILMNILERTREFGVMRAIGTRPRLLFQQIVLETFLLCCIGLFFGLGIAIPIVALVSGEGIMMPEAVDVGGVLFDRWKGTLSPEIFMLPAGLIVSVTLLVCIWPASRASKLKPIDALRSS